MYGTLDELQHNTNIINVAKEAGAKYELYMSVSMADIKDQFANMGPQHPGYNHWQAKLETEKALQNAGFDYCTFFDPVSS